MVLRDFVARAEALGIDYNIVEAIDQPWKTFEGGVGPYWGMFDATRQPKFSWTGPITDPDHWKLAGLAVLLGVLLSLPILAHRRRPSARPACSPPRPTRSAPGSRPSFAFWNGHYFVPGAAFALGLGVRAADPAGR